MGINSYFSYQEVENLDGNNISHKDDAEEKIKLRDKMNQNKLICQTDKAIS